MIITYPRNSLARDSCCMHVRLPQPNLGSSFLPDTCTGSGHGTWAVALQVWTPEDMGVAGSQPCRPIAMSVDANEADQLCWDTSQYSDSAPKMNLFLPLSATLPLVRHSQASEF